MSLLSLEHIEKALTQIPEFTARCHGWNGHAGLIVNTIRNVDLSATGFQCLAEEIKALKASLIVDHDATWALALIREAVGLRIPPIPVGDLRAVTAHEAAAFQAMQLTRGWFDAFGPAEKSSPEGMNAFRSFCKRENSGHDDFQDLYGRISQENWKALEIAKREVSRATRRRVSNDYQGDAPRESLHPAMTSVVLGVAPRDAWSLKQWEAIGTETFHSPTRIQAKWNSMKLAERESICPGAPKTASFYAISRGISRAKIARGDKPRRPLIKRATIHKA